MSSLLMGVDLPPVNIHPFDCCNKSQFLKRTKIGELLTFSFQEAIAQTLGASTDWVMVGIMFTIFFKIILVEI